VAWKRAGGDASAPDVGCEPAGYGLSTGHVPTRQVPTGEDQSGEEPVGRIGRAGRRHRSEVEWPDRKCSKDTRSHLPSMVSL